MFYTNLCFLLVLNVIKLSNGLEPILGIGAAVVTTMGIAYNYGRCFQVECCDNKWINFSPDNLQYDLKENVFGQHFVQKVVVRALKTKFPKKALVMSFHGWTGSGKNLVSALIAKNLFFKGTKSQFFKLYIGSRDFAHKEEVNKYRQSLRSDIEKATAICEQNLFVFDEVDKMAPSILDAISPYVDYHEAINGIDYRKNIFIFLSNSGGNDIAKIALNFWAEGKEREDIKLKDIEQKVSMSAFNEKGGLQHSEIVKKDLIDSYVPFLPLEKNHVKACITAEIRARNRTVNSELVDEIANQLQYFPQDTQLFSVSGCKKISHKLDVHYFDDD